MHFIISLLDRLNQAIKIPVSMENTRVEELTFFLSPLPLSIFGGELLVEQPPLRILVKTAHLQMSRGVVYVKRCILDRFAVVHLWSRKPREPLL